MKKRKYAHNKGLPPGSLVPFPKEKNKKYQIELFDYSETLLDERENIPINDILKFKNRDTITWVNVEGAREPKIIEQLGEYFGHHHLILEDILNLEIRPKIEIFEDYIFIVIKRLSFNQLMNEIETEQISIIFGENYVLSLQEGKEGDPFDLIRTRIKNDKSFIRKQKADFLAYSLIDLIVDEYFTVLELIGEKMESLDEQLIKNPSPDILQQIYNLKREIIFLRKSTWPLREIISKLDRSHSTLIKDSTRIFIRDVYDHTIQIIDTEETFRDMISGMMDLYLSSVSNKMNEIMKVLSIIGTIFIPLTFIAGVYGMNFEHMPELKSTYGYPITLLIMILIAISMLIFFKRKKWI